VHDEFFYDIAGTIVSFENRCDIYDGEFVAPPGQTTRAHKKHAILAHTCNASVNVDELVERARQEGFGWVFFTDDQLPNPWDTLPVFWDDLVAAALP